MFVAGIDSFVKLRSYNFFYFVASSLSNTTYDKQHIINNCENNIFYLISKSYMLMLVFHNAVTW